MFGILGFKWFKTLALTIGNTKKKVKPRVCLLLFKEATYLHIILSYKVQPENFS